MYARKFYRRRPRKYIRRPRKGTKKAAKPSRAFVKKVKKIIHSQTEDKQAYTTSGNSLINFNSGIDSAGDLQFIIPSVANGTADNEKIGDATRAKLLNIKGYLNMAITTDSVTPNKRIGVRLMVVQPKRYLASDDVYSNASGSSGWLSYLLKKGGSQTGFSGQIQDLYAPINTEEITCYYDRVMYLSQDAIYEWAQSTNVGSKTNVGVRNTIKFFNINLKCRNKKLMYDPNNNTGLKPINWSPVLILGYAHLDGSSPDVINTQVGLCWDSYFTYEDA